MTGAEAAKEIIGSLSDIVGLIGAWFLALYFLKRQPIDDAIEKLLVSVRNTADPLAASALAQSAAELHQGQLKTANSAYNRAYMGAVLLVIAIVLKLVPLAFEISEAWESRSIAGL